MLPLQDEAAVGDGLAFDVATLLDRRSLLRGAGAGLAACGSATVTSSAATSTGAVATALAEIPDETVYASDGYSSSVADLSHVSLQGDSVFGDDRGASQLPDVSGDAASGVTVLLVVGIDPTTTTRGGGAPPGR